MKKTLIALFVIIMLMSFCSCSKPLASMTREERLIEYANMVHEYKTTYPRPESKVSITAARSLKKGMMLCEVIDTLGYAHENYVNTFPAVDWTYNIIGGGTVQIYCDYIGGPMTGEAYDKRGFDDITSLILTFEDPDMWILDEVKITYPDWMFWRTEKTEYIIE